MKPNETDERKMLFIVYGVYAVFRRLYEGEEERDTYKALWALQKTLPVVVGFRHVLCYGYDFLANVRNI
jgi:hypothetical protein